MKNFVAWFRKACIAWRYCIREYTHSQKFVVCERIPGYLDDTFGVDNWKELESFETLESAKANLVERIHIDYSNKYPIIHKVKP